MGYTNYWRRKPRLLKATWLLAIADIQKIFDTRPNEVAFESDEPNRPPELSDKLIRFNGIGDEGGETFYLARTYQPDEYDRKDKEGKYFEFCKTCRRPYDEFVQAVLIVLKYYFGDKITMSSDGKIDLEWLHGADYWGQENFNVENSRSGASLVRNVLSEEYLTNFKFG